MKIFAWIMLIIVSLLGLTIVGTCIRACNDAKETAFKEFKPSTLLKKYEYFKDVSAQLDKKVADIKVFEIKIEDLTKSYSGVSRQKWARDDREQLSIWKSELDGMKAGYNELAAQYNADMVKFNYSFCNIGTLPKGAETPLPREFKPYITK